MYMKGIELVKYESTGFRAGALNVEWMLVNADRSEAETDSPTTYCESKE